MAENKQAQGLWELGDFPQIFPDQGGGYLCHLKPLDEITNPAIRQDVARFRASHPTVGIWHQKLIDDAYYAMAYVSVNPSEVEQLLSEWHSLEVSRLAQGFKGFFSRIIATEKQVGVEYDLYRQLHPVFKKLLQFGYTPHELRYGLPRQMITFKVSA